MSKSDLKVKDTADFDIDITIIKKGDFEFKVIIDNCTNFNDLNNIKQLLLKIFNCDSKPSIKEEVEKVSVETKINTQFKKTKTFEPLAEDDDEFDELMSSMI